MCPFVSLQGPVLSEAFRAELAPVGSFASVLVGVCLEITILGEGLGAQFALVRLVFAVDEEVTLKVTVANE